MVSTVLLGIFAFLTGIMIAPWISLSRKKSYRASSDPSQPFQSVKFDSEKPLDPLETIPLIPRKSGNQKRKTAEDYALEKDWRRLQLERVNDNGETF